MKDGNKMKKIWKIFIVTILILPCLFIFNGCSCSNNENNNKNSNITYTITFYTNSTEYFNVPKQEIKEGELVEKPNTSGWYYYNESRQKYVVFADWYSDPSLDVKYVWKFTTDRVYNDLILYAKWDDVPEN